MSGGRMRRVGVLMEPLDTLFFRDGRPFEPASRARSGMPMPQTVSGALRTWFLREADCDLERLAAAMRGGATFAGAAAEQGGAVASVARLSFRGPWFARLRAGGGPPEVLVPVPATLREIEGDEKKEPPPPGESGNGGRSKCHGLAKLEPLLDLDLPGWRPPEEGMRPLWHRAWDELDAPKDRYLTLAGLEKFLCGGTPPPGEVVKRDEILDFDRRTGIAVEPDARTAAEGMIYGVSLLALRRDFALYAEVEGPEEVVGLLPDGRSVPVALGGEGRRAAMRGSEPVQWPSVEPDDGQGCLLVLTTPGIFDGGWRPSYLAGKLLAAAVPGYEAVSGWDLARKGPKPTRFAVPAGSVYFLREPLDPQRRSLCDGEDAALGWGAFVEGVWNRG